ncbi:efflux transporter outer membrane subunit [Herbaspirillum sp. WKF16]|uniref:efflux transporter outer membrane subunit n=1 Tax=Herbaspirillum sp. WKF16 TaxID=3028312 RepID=UPI0023A967A7|nr:efflux transporter outer membrane subunit [Herbaspirillum sp. WKF16]WDZ95815.1 efflux transporter outer membrane subunit [Herbaspirillum sp. WKF16]
MTNAICLTLAALAAGCSLQPTYNRPDAPVAASYPTGPAYGAQAPTATAAAGDLDWQDFLRDPRLRRLVEIALKNNRDLRVAALNVDKVRAQYQVQHSALAPQLDAGADLAASRKPGSVSSSGKTTYTRDYSANLGVSWELDFFGRIRSLSDAALQQYFASGYAQQAAKIALISQVADQYLTLLAYDEQLQITKDTFDTARQSYDIMKLQYDTGTLSELDLRLSQTTLEQAQISYSAQVRAKAQAQNAMVLLIGQSMPADLPAGLTLDRQHLLSDVPAGLPSDLLQHRPDILQAESVLRSENANIGAARAAFFPAISLTGSTGSMSPTLGGLFAPGSGAWTFSPSISLPIFSGGANQANLDAAEVQKGIAAAQYEKAIQTAFKEVADGLAARGTYDDQLAAQQRYADAQQRRLELAQMMYDNGADSYLNVLAAHTDLYNARQSLISARLNRLTNLVDLYRTLGGGWRQRDLKE